MSDFRTVTEGVLASPQIEVADVAAAKAAGVTLIINNRPEGESPDQVAGIDISAAAHAAGIEYVAIPVTHAGFSQAQVDAMAEALAGAEGKVLAYCRSGTRSTLLWALAEASRGRDPGEIAAEAAGAGYDVAPIATMLTMLASRSES
jgi:uncharacterized protein (TIGR01244 family)